jgi:hypothetical protein
MEKRNIKDPDLDRIKGKVKKPSTDLMKIFDKKNKNVTEVAKAHPSYVNIYSKGN